MAEIVATSTPLTSHSEQHRLQALLDEVIRNYNSVQEQSRIKRYLDYMNLDDFMKPNLDAYYDWLKIYIGRGDRPLAPATIASYINTVKGLYKKLLDNVAFNQLLFEHAITQLGVAASYADVSAYVSDMRKMMLLGINTKVEQTKVQDKADGQRLDMRQIKDVLTNIDLNTVSEYRNAAIFALSICTGIRASELLALDIEDLRVNFESMTSLHVKHGKGNKSRLIAYGAGIWCLRYVDAYLKVAEITEGIVFRHIRKGGHVQANGLTIMSLNRIIKKIAGIKPHDMRRTYARLSYDNGMGATELQKNMGHASYDTTITYIGDLSAAKRSGNIVIDLPLRHIDKL